MYKNNRITTKYKFEEKIREFQQFYIYTLGIQR